MSGDDRKPTFSELDRRRREGGSGGGQRAREQDSRRTRDALAAADALFAEADEPRDQAGKALADAVRAAHGTPDLAAACRAYLGALGAPRALDLVSICLDAGDKEVSVSVLEELLRQKRSRGLALEGGLKRQIRLLAEDFDDDLASLAEDLLE